MANKWVTHLKQYSSKHGLSYKEAMGNAKCKAEYHKLGGGKKNKIAIMPEETKEVAAGVSKKERKKLKKVALKKLKAAKKKIKEKARREYEIERDNAYMAKKKNAKKSSKHNSKEAMDALRGMNFKL